LLSQTDTNFTYHQRHLEQAAELVLILYARLWVDESAVVRDRAVRADKNVVRDRLAEDLDLEDIRNDLLRLAVNVWVNKGDVVVARDDVAKRRESLLNALDRDAVRERVAQVLQLLIGCCRGDKKPMSVP
jgi:hypothetical protein